MKADLAKSLKRLECWINSWQTSVGSYNGIIATFWESTTGTIQANSVHQTPIIQGYLNLYQRTGNRKFLLRAVAAADLLVNDIGDDYHYRQTASDIPGRPAGPIQDIECDLALIHLYDRYRNEIGGATKYLEAVVQNVQNYLLTKWWDGRVLSHHVANQIAKSGELFIMLYRATHNQEYLQYAMTAGDWLITHQIKRGPLAGAMEQSLYDSRLIGVYQAPCLPCLMSLYRETQQDKYQQAVMQLTRFINSSRLPDGGFIGLYEQTLLIKTINYFIREFRSVRFALVPVKKTLLNSPIGRLLLVQRREPVFIARTAEILNNLLSCGPVIDLDKHVDFILAHQLASGGIQNWIGTSPADPDAIWAGFVPAMRWNAFVFELLSGLLPQGSNYPDGLSRLEPSYTPIRGYGAMVETQDYFALIHQMRGSWQLDSVHYKSSSAPALNLVSSRRSKNLLIVTPIFPPEIGGCASRMSDFVQFLDKDKWNIHVMTNLTPDSLPSYDPVPVKRIPLFVSSKQVLRLIVTSWQLVNYIIRHKIALVLTTVPPGLHAVLTICITKLLGRCVVLDIRDPWIMGEVYTGTIRIGDWKYNIGRYLERIMLLHADAVISVYQSVAQDIISWHPDIKDKIHWIPNGINMALAHQYDSPLDYNNQALQDKVIFLYQGLMARPQNINRVIELIPQITEQVPSALFVFIGNSKAKEKLMNKVHKMSLDQQVMFKNKMSREEALGWVKRADYGIVSLDDRFHYAIPSKLFDYLIFQKPIVAVVPEEGEADKLIKRYQLGINLLTTPFRPLGLINLDNPVYAEYDRQTNANRLDAVLSQMIIR